MIVNAKAEKETFLYYTIQPFARQFFVSISSVQLIAKKNGTSFFSIKPL